MQRVRVEPPIRCGGIVFVVSAPSGAGKATIIGRVLDCDRRLAHAVSATTRKPRNGAVHGTDYYFVSEEMFRRRVAEGDFIEYAEVHGNLYGTLSDELARIFKAGKDSILELDVQGMRAMRDAGLDVVTIFLMAPSIEELERRLVKRGKDSADEIARRVERARTEIESRHEYDYIIMNERVDDAAADLEAIVRAERRRATRQP
jgi:guanylate kinase